MYGEIALVLKHEMVKKRMRLYRCLGHEEILNYRVVGSYTIHCMEYFPTNWREGFA